MDPLNSKNKNGSSTSSKEIKDTTTLATFFPLETSFGRKLMRLQRDAMILQYNIAVLSTLGGAHHLCNKPEGALVLACQQELVARQLGSSTLLLRSKVFQAVNLGLLEKKRQANLMFRHCEMMVQKEGWTNMSNFVDASKNWLKVELRLIKQQKRRQSSGRMMEGMEEKKTSEDHSYLHHNKQSAYHEQEYSEETKSVFPISPKVEEILTTIQ